MLFFDFDEKEVQAEVIDGNTWFVATDVATVLGLNWERRLLTWFPENWKKRASIFRAVANEDENLERKFTRQGQKRLMWLINERGVMKLAFRSDHPKAEDFTDRVVDFLDDVRTGKLIVENAEGQQIYIKGLFEGTHEIPGQRRENRERNEFVGNSGHQSASWKRDHKHFLKTLPDGLSFKNANEFREWAQVEYGLSKRQTQNVQEICRRLPGLGAHAQAMAIGSGLIKKGWPQDKAREIALKALPMCEAYEKFMRHPDFLEYPVDVEQTTFLLRGAADDSK